jgi:hypothetical protein
MGCDVEVAETRHEIDVHFLGGSVLKGSAAHRRRDQAGRLVEKETPMPRSSRAHDAKARAREARAVMLAKRQAQDERIENATAAALLAIEDRDAAQAEVQRQERTLAAALQRLNLESVTVRDTMTMTGLSEKYVTRLLRLQLNATTDRVDDSHDDDSHDDDSHDDDGGDSDDDVVAVLGPAAAGRVEVGVGPDRAVG